MQPEKLELRPLAKCRRIGASMLLVLRFVATHPGCTKFAVALHLARLKSEPDRRPKGAAAYYDSIDACIRWGLLDAKLDLTKRNCGRGRGVYALTITPSGTALLDERTDR